jgi:hypothetical protein
MSYVEESIVYLVPMNSRSGTKDMPVQPLAAVRARSRT